jgi:methanogenic corrinoid protein MtbC1
MASDLFRASQFDAVDLGAFLPPDDFASFVADTENLVAVGIGVTMSGQEDEVGRTLAALRGVTDVPIIIGGGGVDEASALELGADGWAETGEGAVELVEALLNSRGD